LALVPRFGDEAGCPAGGTPAFAVRYQANLFKETGMTAVWIDVVGVAAAICSMVSFAPQILKIVREHDVSAVSLRMYLITVAGFAFWIAYGTLIGSWPVAVSNAVSLALSATILILKWRLGGVERS
jgi:MtN3 and saliva related transmembrane protein